MTKITIPFGEWRPDLALIDNQFVATAENVFPGANAYLPFPATLFLSASSLSTGNDVFTKVLLHCDGADAATSFPDSGMGGSASHTWTARGNAQVDTAQSKFGGASLLCDGTGDWIDTPDSNDYSLGSSDFFIECWYRPAADGATHALIGQGNNATSAATTSFALFRDSANHINFSLSNGSAFTTITGTTAVVAGAWTHIAAQRSGNTLTLTVGGVSDGTTSFSGSVNDSSNLLAVGALGENSSGTLNGWIDEVRISVGSSRTTIPFTPASVFYDSCRGLFMARATDGTNVFFAGTAIKLYKWTHTTNAWTDVTRTTGNYNLAPGDYWSSAQFGDNVYATHVNDVLQSIDATSGTNFAAVSGSPPQAGHVAVVGDFLVLSGLSTNKRKLQWSAINDPTGWTVGANLSDEQTMPDAGDIRGVCGDTVGLVIQDRAIRTMQFLPGDTDRIFAFSKVESERGAVGKLAFCYTNNTVFMRSSDGFNAWNGSLQPIGQDAVNRWFSEAPWATSTIDVSRYGQMVVFASPSESRIFFAFYSYLTSTTYDRILIYDYHLNRWTYSTEDAQMWGVVADSNGVKRVGCVDTSGLFATLNGTNLAAVIDTTEAHLNPGQRSLVTQVYPVVDRKASLTAPTVTVTPITREDMGEAPTTGTAVTRETTTGWSSIISSARLHQFRVNISANSWSQASGVIVDHVPDGEA